MKIFITGATGFLGHSFALAALKRGHEIACLHRVTYVNRYNYPTEKSVIWVYDDNNLASFLESFKPDVLVHAAWSGVRGKERDSDSVQMQNLIMSERFFKLYRFKQIISLGSQAEYGYYTDSVSESYRIKPITPYGSAKAKCCQLLCDYCETENIEWQWIRIFTIYGESQNGGLIKTFIDRCLQGDDYFATTMGTQKYSYLYSKDYAEAICNVVGQTGKSGVYNLSQPVEIHANREILDYIKKFLKSKIEIDYGAIPYDKNQIMMMDGSVQKFESAFGAIPHSDFKESLASTILSYT